MSTLHTLQDILVRDYRLTHEQVGPEAVLSSLGLDSLSVLELMFKIEDRFLLKILGDTPTELVKVSDVVLYIDALLVAQAPAVAGAQLPVRA
ncbi:MAG: phosphopantetheine-binding protein [Pseudomonadota bacterium]|nr:phosphopantetheine-binding protein [Pseudomonadota bacterium]